MEFMVKLYKRQVDGGRIIVHGNPAHAKSWALPCIRKIAREAGVHIVGGYIRDADALRELCEGCDGCVHMAARVGDWGEREQFERVNVGGTRAALEASAAAGVRRFVQLSSKAVYGRPDEGRITEQWPTRLTGVAYDDTKVESERLAFEYGKELGLEVVAVRPPVIYGPYDRNFLPRLLKLLAKGRVLLVNGGRAPLNMVWVDHVVDVCLLALEKDAAVGEAFNVMDTVSDRPPTVREVGETVARAAGLNAPSLSVPYPIASAFAHVVQAVFTLARTNKPPPITPFVVRLTTLDVIYDASKAVELLGWKPQMRPLEGVAALARQQATER